MSPSWSTNPSVWSYGIAFLAFGGFAVRLALKWQGSRRPVMLVLAVGATALAAAGALAFAVAPSAETWRTAHLLDAVRMASLLGFMLVFLGAGTRGAATGRLGQAWPALLSSVLVLGMLVFGLAPPGVPEFERIQLRFGFGAALATAIFGLVLAEQCYRRTPPSSRWHIRPLVLAFVGVFGYDVVLYSDASLFRTLDENLWAARGVAQAMTIVLLALTVERTRNWTYDVSVSRGVLAGSTALLAAGSYLMLVAGIGFFLRYFGGSWGRALETALTFAALLALAMIAVSSTVRAKLRVLVAKNFFALRFDYRQEWLRFTNTLSLGEAAQPWTACISALGDLVESPGGGLWLRLPAGGLRQVARSGLPRSDDIEPLDSPLCSFLRRTGWVVELTDLKRNPAKYEGLSLPPPVAAMKEAWLIVPLLTGEQLVGFVVLARPRVHIEIDWEVLDLLKTAGRQAASYLAYATATEALLEAKKFDAFNQMSTFVVHDLKNLIAQLRLLLSNAERHRDNPDFQRDMMTTIEHVVGRMHQLMLQLRPDAISTDAPRPIDLAALIRRVQQLRAAGRTGLSVDAPEGILALGHDDMLERVIAHLIQNAFEASTGTPDVRVLMQRVDDKVVMEVHDRGKGMSPDFVRDRLFKPFQTTKEAGMGIGTYESQQYVQGIGGRIEVDSTPGQGTCVRVILRAAAAPAEAGR